MKAHNLELIKDVDFFIIKLYSQFYRSKYTRDEERLKREVAKVFKQKLGKYNIEVLLDSDGYNADIIVNISRLLFKKQIRFYYKKMPHNDDDMYYRWRGICSINETEIEYDNACLIENGLRYFSVERDLWRYLEHFFGLRKIALARFISK
jgi:hypothetical protein